MTAIAEDTDTDVARDLLSAIEPPRCEWQAVPAEPKCPELAEWLMLANCGDAAYFCTPHKERMRAQVFGLPNGTYCSRHPEFGRLLFDWRQL